MNYASFQPMLEAIGQYDMGYKGPSFHDVRVTNLKKDFFFLWIKKHALITKNSKATQEYTGSIQIGQSPEKDQKHEEKTPKPETITYTPSKLKNPKYFCL